MTTAASLYSIARLRSPDAGLLSLRLGGWLVVTLLSTARLVIAFFLLLGGFTAEGFFAHVDNLAARFIAADAGRRTPFLHLVRVGFLLLFLAVAACRWRSLVRCLDLGNGAARE